MPNKCTIIIRMQCIYCVRCEYTRNDWIIEFGARCTVEYANYNQMKMSRCKYGMWLVVTICATDFCLWFVAHRVDLLCQLCTRLFNQHHIDGINNSIWDVGKLCLAHIVHAYRQFFHWEMSWTFQEFLFEYHSIGNLFDKMLNECMDNNCYQKNIFLNVFNNIPNKIYAKKFTLRVRLILPFTIQR